MLEELERALPWAQDNMPPSIVRWMLEALLQGTPDVKRPDDVTGFDWECWHGSGLYYLLSDGFVDSTTPPKMKPRWLEAYRNHRDFDEIRNYKQYEKKKTDE